MMPNWECYYHIVWATKYRQSLITPDLETLIFSTIKRKSKQLNCPTYAINGTEDHVHIAVTVLPKIAVAEWVRQVKGLSAHEVQDHFSHAETFFKWQKGYSVHTLGKKTLPFVTNYIQKQREHHANDTTEPYLEYIKRI